MSSRPLFDLRAETSAPERGKPLSCVSCGLHCHALSPKMRPHGENRRGLMIVGEAPGEVEDERGRPWVGRAGRRLRIALRDLGVDLDRDCVSLNSANCRPPENRTPSDYEVACCRARVVSPAIAEYRPRVIIPMGGPAVSSVLGPLCPDALGAAIGKWRGFAIPSSDLGAWVCPTYHPSYVIREEKRAEVDTVWRQDIRAALRLLDAPVPPEEDLRSRVVILREEGEVLRALYAAHEAEWLSHDYETTGLRPTLHEVVCASFCYSAECSYAFMMPKSGPIPSAWSKLMSDPNVGKVSHHMKFEDGWTRAHYGVDEINWAWDSMLGAHVEDNRVGICGLKLQAFIRFGIRSWGDEIEPYLKSVDQKNPAAPNRLREFIESRGEDECLVYCGIDSLVAYRLAIRQMGIIS